MNLRQSNYGTLSDALRSYNAQGYLIDFNLGEDCISCVTDKFFADEFEVIEVYRSEEESSSADEAIVFAIESNTGLRGILVTRLNETTEDHSSEILSKLKKSVN